MKTKDLIVGECYLVRWSRGTEELEQIYEYIDRGLLRTHKAYALYSSKMKRCMEEERMFIGGHFGNLNNDDPRIIRRVTRKANLLRFKRHEAV